MAIERDVSEEHRPNVSWGAIVGGAMIALATQMIFVTLGSGIGFSAFDPAEGDSLGTGSLVRLGLFTVVTGLVSLFAGGYAAGRLAGFRLRSVAALHGLCSWAAVSVFTFFMLGSGIGGVARTAVGAVRGTADIVASVAGSAAGQVDFDAKTVVAEAKQVLRDTGKAELNPNRIKEEAKSLPAEAAKAQAAAGGEGAEDVAADKLDEKVDAVDRDAIANVIAKRLNVSKKEALSLIGQSEEQAGQVASAIRGNMESLKEKGLQAAQTGTEVAAKVSWGAFFSLLLGAIAAMLGGVVGGPSGWRMQ